jgi:hypothetical protein
LLTITNKAIVTGILRKMWNVFSGGDILCFVASRATVG